MALADSGSMCIMATLMKSAPAKVVPRDLRSLLVLKLGRRRGRMPTKITMKTKSTMKSTFRMAKIVFSSIVNMVLMGNLHNQYFTSLMPDCYLK